MSDPAADLVRIDRNELAAEHAIAHVSHGAAGGVCVFLGTTRDETAPNGKRLIELDYECYEEMAVAKIRALCTEARRRWAISRIAVIHRVGRVAVAKASVVIAVSSGHRAEAFDACRFLIDELKRVVPIWKKEVWEDGSITWVDGTVPLSGA